MKSVTLHDKTFRRFLAREQIEHAVGELADRLNRDYTGRETPLLVGVLNGSFMFLAELAKRIDFPCEITFIKVASYSGTGSSGEIAEVIGLADDIRGRHVIVVEDIVDTGGTVEHLMRTLGERGPASVEVASLLFKPQAYQKTFPVRYALSVPNDFVVGYGLDYDGLGRNLPDLYVCEDE